MTKFINKVITSAIFLITVTTIGQGFIQSVDVRAQQPPSVTCPCDYSAIPMTAACWLEPFHGSPVRTEFEPTKCFLLNSYNGTPNQYPPVLSEVVMGLFEDPTAPGTWGCSVVISALNLPSLTACGPSTETSATLTAQQLSACKAEIEEYITALNEVQGISVPGGPPYTCPFDDSLGLAPSPTPVPTLSEPYAYVTSFGESPDYDGTVAVIDTSTNKVVDTLDGFYGANDVAITPDGKFAYVASILSDNPPAFGSQVSVIDVSTNKVVATVDVSPNYGPELVAATPDGKYVYVANYNGSVSVIDVSTNKVIATLDVGSEPSFIAISPDSQYIYVYTANYSLYVIEESSNTVFESYSITPDSFGYVGGIAVSPLPEDSFFPLYVTGLYTGGLGTNSGGLASVNLLESLADNLAMNFPIFTTFNTASKQVGPVAVTPDGNFIYVGSSNGVFVIERVNNKSGNLTDTINLGSSTVDLSVTPDGKFVYVLSNNISVIDVSTNKVVATVDLGGENTSLAITPNIGFGEEPPTGEENVKTGGGCSIASSTNSNASFPVYLLIPAFILIARLWRRRTNQKHTYFRKAS